VERDAGHRLADVAGFSFDRTSLLARRGSPGLTDSPRPLSSTARTDSGSSMP
jgi:hypothetical protein